MQQVKQKHKKSDEYRVFVGNLPFSWLEDAVRSVFHSYGTVVDVEVPRKREQPERNRGFAFVYFSSREEALAATTLSGSRLDGRIIKVEWADDGSEHRKVGHEELTQRPTHPLASSQVYEWGGQQVQKQNDSVVSKETPNFMPSGALYKEQRMTRYGKELKFVEPLDARKPEQPWRMYVFKNGKLLEGEEGVFYIHQKSNYLFGRDRDVVDIPIDHPSASKQHAVLQFRQVMPKNGNKLVIKPYIMDLESTNGTFLNNERIESLRYYELLEKDLLRFGHSSREFILLTGHK
ncbi:Smad nuclear interacting protein 1 isoform 1 [Galdieria sulphuraria]|uniref:Smad nuclear interacting protein 1 isoform 1 n=1 Tax=Galdieria sulphuraria TaxID=130081 RepID=M2Y0P4_GALSU|nr:Smad nuclear interacting protein 1 isoform 1 [Galdieria sulphuraria]EME29379.1 Smad nuclear interacting protein 1 isoform 1 [Galdieria sulphuraria]|eukprot:XP_005705899.1 Smad nuclear interacting protein 1 isoform 1 [Galdieria sulphuraria]